MALKFNDTVKDYLTAIPESEKIEAETKAIKHHNLREWVKLVIGLLLVIVGIIYFIKDSINLVSVGVMLVGVFIMSSTKPKIDNLLD